MASRQAHLSVAIFMTSEQLGQRNVAHELYRLLMSHTDKNNGSTPFIVRIFEFPSNKPSLQKRIERAHETGCNLFVIQGEETALSAKEICHELKIRPVMICVGVHPSTFQKDGSNRSITVSSEDQANNDLALFLLRLKGHVSRILLPYLKGGAGGNLEAKALSIKDTLEAEGIAVELSPVSTAEEVLNTTKLYLGSFNFLLALEGCITNEVPGLAKLCADNDVLFFTGNGIDGVNSGSTGAYGGDAICLATPVFEAIKEILLHGKSPDDIGDLRVPYLRYFVINRVMFLQAGFPLELLNDLATHKDMMVDRKFIDLASEHPQERGAIMAKPARIGIIFHPENADHAHIANTLAKLLETPSAENEYSPALLPTNFTMESVRERIILGEKKKMDFYISIGSFFASALNDLFKEIEAVPTLFLGVVKPVENGLTESLARPNKPMSGVVMQLDSFTRYAEFIAACYPRYQNVLLLYKHDALKGWLQERAEATALYLEARNIKPILVPINSVEEALDAVEKYISQTDCLLLLEGCRSTQVVDYLARLYFRAEKTLFANVGKAGIILGAPFSYGPNPQPLIKEIINMVHAHFDKRKPLEFMAVRTVPNNRVLYINKSVLRLLGETAQFIEKLEKMADGVNIVMLNYWPAPPPEAEQDRPFEQNKED